MACPGGGCSLAYIALPRRTAPCSPLEDLKKRIKIFLPSCDTPVCQDISKVANSYCSSIGVLAYAAVDTPSTQDRRVKSPCSRLHLAKAVPRGEAVLDGRVVLVAPGAAVGAGVAVVLTLQVESTALGIGSLLERLSRGAKAKDQPRETAVAGESERLTRWGLRVDAYHSRESWSFCVGGRPKIEPLEKGFPHLLHRNVSSPSAGVVCWMRPRSTVNERRIPITSQKSIAVEGF